MVDSEYNCKSSEISTEAMIKNPEILRFVPDHLKTKKMYKIAVKMLLFLMRYVPY